MIIYNPVARPRIALTRFPVNREHFTVTDDQGQTIPAQVGKKKQKKTVATRAMLLVEYFCLFVQVVEVTNSTANIRGINGSLYELVIAVIKLTNLCYSSDLI